MRRLALLTILAVLLIPALAQAHQCPDICENERQQCMESQCPGMDMCEECDQVYYNCLSSCQEPPPPPDCIPSGGVDDVLYETHCCSGAAVPGSTHCADPADWYDDWESCTQICA